MAMKRILVPVEKHALIEQTLATAALFARQFGAEIEGVPTRPLVEDIYVGGALGGIPVPHYEVRQAVPVSELRATFESAMRAAGISGRAPGSKEAGFIWRGGDPLVESQLGLLARVFDITAFARPLGDGASPRISTLETILFESGRPLLIAPPKVPTSIGRHVMIAWNCSTETARCVALGMPLIERAEKVSIITVEGGTVTGPSGAELASLLAVNGIKAEERVVKPGGRSAGEKMLDEAMAAGADLLIKGAYTQSRLRQMIFGGATSHILAAAELPVFMSH
jgi:nucleotide-binding universal stress UspA family protein